MPGHHDHHENRDEDLERDRVGQRAEGLLDQRRAVVERDRRHAARRRPIRPGRPRRRLQPRQPAVLIECTVDERLEPLFPRESAHLGGVDRAVVDHGLRRQPR